MPQTITVTNLDYFLALESAVRTSMKGFETSLLPVARKALKDAGCGKSSDPVEGYYHETPELTEWFLSIRALQDAKNFTTKKTKSIKHLHGVYTHPVFGLKQSFRTAIQTDPNKVADASHDPVTISPVRDPITVACKLVAASLGPRRPWTTRNVMDAIDLQELGTCLVGLANLVDRKTPGNPVATTCACETTVLSREKFMSATSMPMPKSIDWQVDADVESYGEQVCQQYNDLFIEFTPSNTRPPKSKGIMPGGCLRGPFHITAPTPKNIEHMLKDLPDIRRCVNIAIDGSEPAKPLYYHWAIDTRPGDGVSRPTCAPTTPRVVDFYMNRIVTTKEYQQNPGAILNPTYFTGPGDSTGC